MFQAAVMSDSSMAVVRKLLCHLDNDAAAGCIVIMTRELAIGVTVETSGSNVTLEGMRCGLILQCESLIRAAKNCECGADHGPDIRAVNLALEWLQKAFSGE